jgi:hypothetical protein
MKCFYSVFLLCKAEKQHPSPRPFSSKLQFLAAHILSHPHPPCANLLHRRPLALISTCLQRHVCHTPPRAALLPLANLQPQHPASNLNHRTDRCTLSPTRSVRLVQCGRAAVVCWHRRTILPLDFNHCDWAYYRFFESVKCL